VSRAHRSQARQPETRCSPTPFEKAPWYVVDSNNKRKARLNLIAHLLDQIPYGRAAKPVKLPPRQNAGRYREPEWRMHIVPDRY
jgi:hypothetical protein